MQLGAVVMQQTSTSRGQGAMLKSRYLLAPVPLGNVPVFIVIWGLVIADIASIPSACRT
jgi:hypothetical protein